MSEEIPQIKDTWAKALIISKIAGAVLVPLIVLVGTFLIEQQTEIY